MAGCDDIDRWRAVWGDCLREATSVLCFSGSSRDLVARAYRTWVRTSSSCSRTSSTTSSATRSRQGLDRPLHIGVVGEITKAKGRGHRVGDGAPDSPAAPSGQDHRHRATGGQARIGSASDLGPTGDPRLPHLIEQCSANVFLLPSIWPETFSYVAEELMRLGCPPRGIQPGGAGGAGRTVRARPGPRSREAAHALEAPRLSR